MDFKNVVSATKSFSFCLLLFTFYLSSLFLAQAARNPPPPPAKQKYYHVINLTSLHPKPYCESHSAGSSLESEKITMASIYGPCSPHNHAKTVSSSGELFQNEKAKKDSMEYYFTVGLGTPKTDYDLFVDTGSDNTWVRCQPCSTGCKSKDPLFDPSKSSTYVNGSCRSGDGNDFNSGYVDESTAKGHWGCDTLTIEKSAYVVKKFQFGCAQHIKDTVGDNFGGDDGILGLGRGDLSLPSQGGFQIFGYCIPMRNSQLGYLVFGREATAKMSSSSYPKFTPLLNSNGKSFYFVELIGMSVAGKRLDNVDPSIFNSPGTIIDSGTSFTRLPHKAYSALSTAFNQTMGSKYPAATSNEMPELDTCYNVDGFDTTNISVPAITFHFKGISKGEIDVELRPSGIVLTPPSEPNLVCLSFTHKDDTAIIGNHQQRQMGMFFDLQGKRIGFGTNNCDS